jgi:hypothetical protein
MNQKRNQIVITDLKIWNWTRLLISRSPVRARQGAQKVSLKVFKSWGFFIVESHQTLTTRGNQKANQWGLSCCCVIVKWVIISQLFVVD